MKKIIPALLFAILLIGCTKQSEDVSQLSSLTKEVITQESVASMQQSYMLLSNAEKEDLWRTKLKAILVNDAATLTTNQASIVQQILSLLNTHGMEYLRANPQVGETLIDNNLAYFETQFTKEQLNMLIECPYYEANFSIFKAAEYFSKIVVPIDDPEGGSKCKCRYNISCGVLTGYCNWSAPCTIVYTCGLFGTSSCKGLCD